MRVTVRVEWDMGHRLPNHNGACRNLHGHRYVAEVALEGAASDVAGAPDEGMVADFADVKAAVRAEVEKLDHRFLLCDRDWLLPAMIDLPGVVSVPFVPTAENIACALLSALRLSLGAAVAGLRLHETPTSWADAS